MDIKECKRDLKIMPITEHMKDVLVRGRKYSIKRVNVDRGNIVLNELNGYYNPENFEPLENIPIEERLEEGDIVKTIGKGKLKVLAIAYDEYDGENTCFVRLLDGELKGTTDVIREKDITEIFYGGGI